MCTEGIFIVVVGASSKKAGKSSLASFLVRELGAEYAIKVSAGGSHQGGDSLINDPAVIAVPGTDTAALSAAGAGKVLWVNCPEEELEPALKRALDLLGHDGVLVVEGNSALRALVPGFTVFVVAAPFDEFKPSAAKALEKADLVLVDRTGTLAGSPAGDIRRRVAAANPRAAVVVFSDGAGRLAAWESAAAMARDRLA